MSSVAVGIFCKTPAAGFSKTRLVAAAAPGGLQCHLGLLHPRSRHARSIRWAAM